MQASQRQAAAGWGMPWPGAGGYERGFATLLLVLAGCALPPAVTPEDPPWVEAQPAPSADGLSEAQHRSLRAGGRVEEPVELERHGQRYVGGVSYVLVRAQPSQVFGALNQLETLANVLPQTRHTRVVDRTGSWVRVEIEQGNSVVSTTFTVFFEQQLAAGREESHQVRFWLDPSQPHGIDDVWGFFRATRYDAERSLVAVGALVNLGPGLIRMLFEERIQRAILRMPNRVRDVIERVPGGPGAAASASRGANL